MNHPTSTTAQHTASLWLDLLELTPPTLQVPHLFLPAVLQRLAPIGPGGAVLRLAGGQHPPGGDAGRRTQRRHPAAGGGTAGAVPPLRLLSAGGPFYSLDLYLYCPRLLFYSMKALLLFYSIDLYCHSRLLFYSVKAVLLFYRVGLYCQSIVWIYTAIMLSYAIKL